MRNQLFVPDFLFDFYTKTGSNGTPSALSNVSRSGLGKLNFAQSRQSALFAFLPCLITRYRKSSKPRETILGSLVVRWVMYWYSLKHLLYSIYFADRWRCKCAVHTLPRKHVQVGKWALLPFASNFVALHNLKFARRLCVVTKRSFSDTWLV